MKMHNLNAGTCTQLTLQTILTAVCGIAALIILSLVSQINYLFFHSIVGVATFVVRILNPDIGSTGLIIHTDRGRGGNTR